MHKIKDSFSLIEERIGSFNSTELNKLREENNKLKMENFKLKTDDRVNKDDSFERGMNNN